MAYKSLNDFIKKLESENELIRVKEFVNPELEITEIIDRLSKSPDGGKAVLFENTGTKFPVLINAMGSERRMCMSLGVKSLDDIGIEIEDIFKELISPKANIFDKLKLLPKFANISSWMPKSISGKGVCQEIIQKNPDISKFPVLKCWPEDGGPFITLPMVITKDPLTGIRNVGMYRMQVFEKKLTGMHWHKHKVGARHFEEYKKLGEKIPIAVALGGDPAYTYAATAPVPDNVDEFLLAGFLRKKKVELVKCITQDIEVPADADIIIEGFVDPNEDFIWEGPFGDHTGFYSLADWYPQFHITCITHKKNAIYPATIVGVPPMEDAWIGKATERIFLSPIRLAILPEILDYDLPFEGVAHNIAIVKINKTYAGQAFKVMNSMWGAGQMMFNKIMIIVDKDIDIHDYSQLALAIIENTDSENDIHFISGPMDVLDHSSSNFTFGSKMGIDATIKFPEELKEEDNVADEKSIDSKEIVKQFIEIENANILQKLGILIISVKKESKQQIEELCKKLSNSKTLDSVRFVFIVDNSVEINDLSMVSWIVSGNIDPKRDSIISNSTISRKAKIYIDATKKSLDRDKFKRDWPNIVISNKETIDIIDNKWNSLGLGEFVKSPSLKYKQLNNNSGAISTS